MSVKINNYALFKNDDAIYVAKSEDDVLEYYKSLVGDDLDGGFDSDEDFKEQLIELDINSDYVTRKIKIHDNEKGGNIETTIYDLYKEEAKKSVKCKPIVWFNW